jgi:hypothetical protein
MSKERDQLNKAFDELLAPYGLNADGNPGNVEARQAHIMATLGRSVLMLDKSSSRLALVNIILAFVLVIAVGVQIWLMLRGH